MLTDLLYLTFLLSVAMASGAIILSVKLRSRYDHRVFSSLMYYQVFIYAFGFYGIWGMAAIRAFLASYVSPELIGKLSDLALLMGLPFLIFSWLMLLQFSFDLSGHSKPVWFTLAFLTVNFLLILALAIFVKISGIRSSIHLIKYCFLSAGFIYTLTSSILILYPNRSSSVIHDHDRNIIGLSVTGVMLFYSLPLLFYTSQIYLSIAFIFAFFAGNPFLPVYLSYCTLLSSGENIEMADRSFEAFCSRYDVSPRESDIVREICNGLSNKEISDKLFISLQTVKDHTHRIYIKTNVRNRVRLINLVRELRKT